MSKATDITASELEMLRARKPARRGSEIPANVLAVLTQGLVESKNLVEWLNVDRITLAESIARLSADSDLVDRIQSLRSTSKHLAALKLSKVIASHFSESVSLTTPHFQNMAGHTSDVVREWAALMIGLQQEYSFAKKLAWMKPFADDPNPGVREVAWIALRTDVIADPMMAIQKLVPWTGSRQERLRRFASEVTRPRGVWAAHVPFLKQNPQLGIPLLEPLRSDSSKYVRDSVANWLNDAGKSNPQWVVELTTRWARESESAATQAIIKRALRNLR